MIQSVVFFLLMATAQPAELLFREDWSETPAELPLSQDHVSNPDLVVSLHGPGQFGIKKSHHDWIPEDPFYVWSGACPGNWAVSLRHREKSLNLSGAHAMVRWRSRQSGFRRLRLILKLKDGGWLVSDTSDEESPGWRDWQAEFAKVRWRTLDIGRVAEGARVEGPDLTRVDEVGFTDLMPGGGSDACSRLDWIEVHGNFAAPTPAPESKE